MKNPPKHIRRLHLCELDTDGRVHPIHDVSPSTCASVETVGFEVMDGELNGSWGVFNHLIRCGERVYLAAIY